MTEKSKKPRIRFKGFTDAWEQRKLGELVERVVRKNENMESNLPLTVSAEYGLVDQITFFNNRVASQNISGYYLLYRGDFAYNKSTSASALWGAVKRLDLYENGVLSTLYIVFKPKKISSEFLLRYYETDYWHPEMKKIASEGARNHGLLNISPIDFFESELKVPVSSKEQELIGEMIREVSSLITLHQRKYDKLTAIKKALLEKMFPADGETVPKIRFKGFSDAWEQRQFGYFFTERNERSGDGEMISVTINSGIKRFDELNRHDTKPDDLSKYKRVEVGDIAYNSMRMWQGASGYSPYSGILSPAYTVITPKNDVSARFFAYVLKQPKMIHQFEINSQGLTKDTWNLKFPAFAPIEVKAPITYEEQAQIATILLQVDDLITLHQRQLEKLKNIKSALLEKMFV